MSLFARTTDLPPAINTVERLAAWSGLLLHDLNRGFFYKETNDPNGSVLQATAGILETADGTDRLLIRLAIPMDKSWRFDKSKKIWMFANDLRDTAIPGAFKVD